MTIFDMNSPLIFIILVIILYFLGPKRIEKGYELFLKLLKFLLSNNAKEALAKEAAAKEALAKEAAAKEAAAKEAAAKEAAAKEGVTKVAPSKKVAAKKSKPKKENNLENLK